MIVFASFTAFRIGCYLLRQPEKVRNLVRGVKDRLGWGYPISVKIRIDQDLKSVSDRSTAFSRSY